MELENIIKGIYDNQEKIREQIKDGDSKAKSVADFYNLVAKYPDRASVAFLESAYEDWCKENSIPY